ncbi:Hypothetical predicted protein [Mytilus galloprovincialis]|uniref:AIG1-type G domain-containing protein n=1 Tax=Mytilus galloprovincialis TaxID=29158 RepID=A0A8B6GLD7_MYTGA|nr:Hypothetical predicted protein [Mytilus galloprovincialis]
MAHGNFQNVNRYSNKSFRTVATPGGLKSGSKRTGSEDSESPNIDDTYNHEQCGESVTKKCKLGITIRFNRKLVVVDTPGLQDTEMEPEEVIKEIVKCIGMTAPGPHAFLLTVNLGTRFTKEEQETVEHFVKYFGNELYKYLLVVFTRADNLEEENTNIRDYVKSCPKALKTILNLCDHHYIPFNNKRIGNSQEQQVKNLIRSVDEIVCKHGGFCYTNEMFKEAEKNLQRREEEAKRKLVEEEQRKVENIKCHFQTEYDKKLELANEEKVKLEAEIKQTNKENKDRLAQLQKQLGDNDRSQKQQMEDLRKESKQEIWEVKENYRREIEKLRDVDRIGIEKGEDAFSQIVTGVKAVAKGVVKFVKDCSIM